MRFDEFPATRALLPDEEQIGEAIAIIRAECLLDADSARARRLAGALHLLAGRDLD